MNIKIINKNEQPLLARIEIEAELSYPKATPSNKEVAENIASQLKIQAKNVVIKHIYTKFGTQDAKVVAYAYKTPEDKERIERKTKHLVEKEKKEKESAKKPAEEAKPAEQAQETAPEQEAEQPAAEESEEQKVEDTEDFGEEEKKE